MTVVKDARSLMQRRGKDATDARRDECFGERKDAIESGREVVDGRMNEEKKRIKGT